MTIKSFSLFLLMSFSFSPLNALDAPREEEKPALASSLKLPEPGLPSRPLVVKEEASTSEATPPHSKATYQTLEGKELQRVYTLMQEERKYLLTLGLISSQTLLSPTSNPIEEADLATVEELIEQRWQQGNQRHILDLSNLHLSVLPESIGKYSAIKSLKLDNNNLRLLPPSVFTLAQRSDFTLSVSTNPLLSPLSLIHFLKEAASGVKLIVDPIKNQELLEHSQLQTVIERIKLINVTESFNLEAKEINNRVECWFKVKVPTYLPKPAINLPVERNRGRNSDLTPAQRVWQAAIKGQEGSTFLHLVAKDISEIPDNIGEYSIHSLRLDDNQLTALPPSFKKLMKNPSFEVYFNGNPQLDIPGLIHLLKESVPGVKVVLDAEQGRRLQTHPRFEEVEERLTQRASFIKISEKRKVDLFILQTK